MPQFIDRDEVQRVTDAISRLGTADDYALILEPVRSWYYVLLVYRATADGPERRHGGIHTQTKWRVEEEFGPLRGNDVRQLVRTSNVHRTIHPRDDALQPLLTFVLCGDPGLVTGKRTLVRAVKRGEKHEAWTIARTEHVKQWPDLEKLADHGRFKMPDRYRHMYDPEPEYD
jgi:hypothetical protein